MARVHSILAALSLAALVGMATVKPVLASASISPALSYSVARGGSVSITGTTKTSGTYTSDVYIVGIPTYPAFSGGLSFAGATPSGVGADHPFAGPLGTLYADATAPAGTSTYTIYFTSTGGDPTALIDITVTDVPEPGAVAFGVLAAGSVLGLVARRRKTA